MVNAKEIEYDKFFPALEDNLRSSLPAGLTDFNWQRPGNNYFRVRFPTFRYSYYELQFSQHSTHHAGYFGEGPHTILAFYYEASLNKRNAWLKAIDPYVEHIHEQLGRTIKSGMWGKHWACIITNLDHEALTPEHFSRIIAFFIQATYIPIMLAFIAMSS